jgi:nucleoside diphosphate kinase
MERTLAIIKPDAIRAARLRDIQQLVASSGFTVLDERTVQVRELIDKVPMKWLYSHEHVLL